MPTYQIGHQYVSAEGKRVRSEAVPRGVSIFINDVRVVTVETAEQADTKMNDYLYPERAAFGRDPRVSFGLANAHEFGMSFAVVLDGEPTGMYVLLSRNGVYELRNSQGRGISSGDRAAVYASAQRYALAGKKLSDPY